MCTNSVLGYDVKFPPGWHTAAPAGEEACRWFDPQPFVIEKDTEGPFTALEIDPADVSLEEAVRGVTAPAVSRTLLREDTRLDGQLAVRLEIEATGIGPTPKGTRSYVYLIDLGPRGALVVETTSLAGLDLCGKQTGRR